MSALCAETPRWQREVSNRRVLFQYLSGKLANGVFPRIENSLRHLTENDTYHCPEGFRYKGTFALGFTKGYRLQKQNTGDTSSRMFEKCKKTLCTLLPHDLCDRNLENVLSARGLEPGNEFVNCTLFYDCLDAVKVNSMELAHGGLFHCW